METFQLADVQSGQKVKITAIHDLQCELQALRMGIAIGEEIICVSKIPSGPVVIQRGGMEVAIGRELCQMIEVEPV